MGQSSYRLDAQLQPAAAVWWNGTGRDRGGAIRSCTSRIAPPGDTTCGAAT